MTKKVVPYLIVIFVSLFFQSTSAQVNPDINSTNDTIRITGIADTSITPAGIGKGIMVQDSLVAQPRKNTCDTIAYKLRTYMNRLADETGLNRLSNSVYNLLEIRRPGDSLKVFKHSPKKAAWFSAFLPGLGQIYNRKYWKLPIIYAGFGVIGYLGYNYNNKAQKYKSSYLLRSETDLSKTDYYPEITSEDILYQNFTYYRRNFELTCIFGSLFYILNIIDASVDAHLYKFDISEDLSLRIEPDIINYTYAAYNTPSTGFKVSLHF